MPTIAGAGLVLVAVGLGAAMLPAWRAATVNPAEALHS
jgi:ABC-type antimicrobial peptide transport system permease subunit